MWPSSKAAPQAHQRKDQALLSGDMSAVQVVSGKLSTEKILQMRQDLKIHDMSRRKHWLFRQCPCCQHCCGKLWHILLHRRQQSGHEGRQASGQPGPADEETRDRRAGYASSCFRPCRLPCRDCHQCRNIPDSLTAPCRRCHLATASPASTAERRRTVIPCVPSAQPDGSVPRDFTSQCSA